MLTVELERMCPSRKAFGPSTVGFRGGTGRAEVKRTDLRPSDQAHPDGPRDLVTAAECAALPRRPLVLYFVHGQVRIAAPPEEDAPTTVPVTVTMSVGGSPAQPANVPILDDPEQALPLASGGQLTIGTLCFSFKIAYV